MNRRRVLAGAAVTATGVFLAASLGGARAGEARAVKEGGTFRVVAVGGFYTIDPALVGRPGRVPRPSPCVRWTARLSGQVPAGGASRGARSRRGAAGRLEGRQDLHISDPQGRALLGRHTRHRAELRAGVRADLRPVHEFVPGGLLRHHRRGHGDARGEDEDACGSLGCRPYPHGETDEACRGLSGPPGRPDQPLRGSGEPPGEPAGRERRRCRARPRTT